jgi:subtilase family serine protease
MLRILNSSSRAVKYLPGVAAGLVAIAAPVLSFGQAVPRITQPVNESTLVTLKGSTHPWALARFDRGPVEDSHAGRMLLVLKRSPEQDAALRQLVSEQQIAGSPNFHKWLTPDEFGKKFGVADADVQTVTGYLQAQGFTVGRVYKNKAAIEVSGTAGQLRETFHTQMHMYSIGGHEFYANATDPKIPAALAPVVRGFAALNNIQASHLNADENGIERANVPVVFDAKTHRAVPQYTGNIGYGNFYLLAPSDIQTIYNIPVSTTSPGAGGNGVTIGVIGDSQVNLNLIAQYQQLGGSGANLPVEVVDGSDPVIVPTTTGPDATIAYEQLELLSAAAPNANVNYYVSSTTDYDTGLDFAIIRAIEDNAASVLTMGFQSCEKNLTAVGNELIESSWLQAEAQGITVVVAAGDTGSGGCDVPGSTSSSTGGLAVNGYASTPYDTAVGGTDFTYGAPGPNAYWSTTNSSTYGSAPGYIPEQAWNDSIQTNDYITGTAILNAGGGGFSTLGNVAADDVTQSPYPVPSWQVNAQRTSGVTTPTARSLPDVSFFAGNGYNDAWYVICAAAGDCKYTNTTATLIGGTAGSSAVFAGIMADVVEKYGLQGNANPALYGLAATLGVFHDSTTSNNSLACTSGTGCTGGYLTSGGVKAYTTGVGYDEATGFGSVNATNLINNWKVPATAASTTSLVVRNDATNALITTVVHGTPLKLVATVTGSGTPTGNVAFMSGNAAQASNGTIAEPLVAGVATSPYNLLLPGGTYNVSARYAGDATNLPSVGTYPVIVTPEPTRILTISSTYASGSSVPYGTTVKLTVEPFSLADNTVAAPTGTMGFHNNSNDPMTILPLSSEGTATFSTNLLGGGQTYDLVFAYSGDRSYQNSTTQQTPYIIQVTQAATTTALAASSSASVNTPVTLSATVSSPASLVTGVPPSGTVSFNTAGGTTIANLNGGFSTTGQAIGVATIQVAPTQIPSNGSITATYSSDVNYQSSSQNIAISTGATHVNTTGLTLSVNSTSVATDGTLTLTVKGTASTGTPAGTVQVTANGVSIGSFSLTVGTSTNWPVPLTNGYLPFASGTVAITTVFTPSLPTYGPSSATQNVTVTDDRTVGDFSVSTDVQTQTITSSSNIVFFKVQLTAIQNFAGLNDPISLTCTVPGVSNLNCDIGNDYITVGNSGTAITTMTISGRPTGGTGALHPPVQPEHWWMVGGGSALAFVFILGIPARRKGFQGMMAALVCLVLVSASITGCGSSSNLASSAIDAGSGSKFGGSGGSAAVTYTKGLAANSVPPGNYQVVVTATATANTMVIHNTSVTVVVNTGQLLANGSYTLSSYYSNLLLDSNGSTTSGSGLVQNAISGSNNQKWTFAYQSNGYYLIKNVSSGLYLTDPGAQVGIIQVTQQTATGDGTQLWTLNPLEGGYELVNAQSGGVLAADTLVAQTGGPVICNTQKNITDGLDETYYIQ